MFGRKSLGRLLFPLAATAVPVLAFLAAPSAAGAAPLAVPADAAAPVQLTDGNSGQMISVRPGQIIKVDLRGEPGRRCSIPVPSDPHVLQPLSTSTARDGGNVAFFRVVGPPERRGAGGSGPITLISKHGCAPAGGRAIGGHWKVGLVVK